MDSAYTELKEGASEMHRNQVEEWLLEQWLCHSDARQVFDLPSQAFFFLLGGLRPPDTS